MRAIRCSACLCCLLFAALPLGAMSLKPETPAEKAIRFQDEYPVALLLFENHSGNTNYDYLSVSLPLLLRDELNRMLDIFVDPEDLVPEGTAAVSAGTNREMLWGRAFPYPSLDGEGNPFTPPAPAQLEAMARSNASPRRRLRFLRDLVIPHDQTLAEVADQQKARFILHGRFSAVGRDRVRIRVLFYSAAQRRNVKSYEAEYPERRALLELPELAERMRKDLVRFPTAALRIESEPSGALAYVNGVFVGRTPLSLPAVAATNHVVFVKQDGYLDRKSELQLAAGGNYVHRVVLESEARDAVLEVLSIPAGATVLVDLVRKGKTPLVLSNMRPGDYRVQVELDGHHQRLSRARLAAGKKKTLSLALDPIVPGALTLEERIDRHRKWMNVFFWSGAGSLLVYGVLYFTYEDYLGKYKRNGNAADYSTSQDYHKAANVALGVTAVTLATSGYFLIRYLLADDKELGMAPVDTRTFYAALGPNEVYLNWRF